MKLLFKLIILTPLVAAGLFLYYRYDSNQVSEVPYPYTFSKSIYNNVKIDAPILIIGDRLGKRLSSFTNSIAELASQNLSNKIKIETLAVNGEGLHRTLEKVKKLGKLPLITIYLGGSEEYHEKRFRTKDSNKIIQNFEIYNDDIVKTLLMVFPSLSPFIYNVVKYKNINEQIKPDDLTKYSDVMIQKRNIIHFKIYEQELDSLFSYLKEKNSYLIALTQPLNLDIPPKKNCSGSIDELSENNLKKIVELIKKKDFKSAYNQSKDLVLIANASAKVMFVHGKIAKNLGKLKEAAFYLKMAMAYDCKQWRGNPVYNKILTQIAIRNDVPILDFQKILERQWTKNILFEDEIYPQNLYYEKVAKILAAKIKKLLKL